jgi:hypothetical protein
MSVRLLYKYASVLIFAALVSTSANQAPAQGTVRGSAVRGQYSLNILAKTGDVVDGQQLGLILDTAINDPGEVAFTAYCTPGLLGIFTLSRVVTLVNAVIGGKTLTGFGTVAINNQGSMAFQGASVQPGPIFEDGVFTLSRLLATTGSVIGGKTLINSGSPTINERGKVVFQGVYAAGQGIFTPSEALIKAGDVVDGKLLTAVGAFPALNNRDVVAVLVLYSGGYGIWSTDSGFVVQSGDIVAGKRILRVAFTAINDAGEVAYTGSFEGGNGVFFRSQLIAQTGTIEGKLVQEFSRVAINNRGDIVYLSQTARPASFEHDYGVFAGTQLLLYTGDTLAGKPVKFVGPPAINNNGHILFRVGFSDGTWAIVLARPNGNGGER